MRRSSVNKPRDRKEDRHGLKDMFVNRPRGAAGLIMSIVWGDSEDEFAEIVADEVKDCQRRRPDRFVNKIKPWTGGRGRRSS